MYFGTEVIPNGMDDTGRPTVDIQVSFDVVVPVVVNTVISPAGFDSVTVTLREHQTGHLFRFQVNNNDLNFEWVGTAWGLNTPRTFPAKFKITGNYGGGVSAVLQIMF